MSNPFHGTVEDGQAVLEALPVGISIYDAEQRLVFVNAAHAAVLGLPAGALQPRSSLADNVRMIAYRGVFGPGDPEAHAAEVLALDTKVSRRIRRRHPDGRSSEAHYIPLADGAHMACVVDTTAITALRDEAERTASQVQVALAGLRVGLAVFGADRSLLLHNARFAELLSLPAAGLRAGLSLIEVLQLMQARDEYSGFEGDLFLASQLSLDRSRPSSFRRQLGSSRVVDVQSEPLPGGGWAMTVSDISALARAEDEARRRAGLLDSVVQHIPHGIAVYGPDRRVTMVNADYARVMAGAPITVGDSLEEVIRRRAAAGEYGPGDPGAIFEAQMAYDVTQLQQRRRTRPNGTTVEVRTAPLPDGGYMSVVTDLTALTAAQDEVQRNARAMDSMLANIRHGIILWGSDRRIIASNPRAAAAINAPPGLVVPGRTLAELTQSALERGNLGGGPDAEEVARELLARDRSKPYLDQRLTLDGRLLEVRSDPTPDGGFVTTYTDLTGQRYAEAVLLNKASEAGRAAPEDMAALARKLRAPLLELAVHADALARRASDAPAAAASAEGLAEAARSLIASFDAVLGLPA